jgi:cytochrome c oxidase assembly protein subunit 15
MTAPDTPMNTAERRNDGAVRGWLYAVSCAGRPHGGGRRGDAAHRFRPVDRGVAAGHRDLAAAERGRLAEFEKYKTSSEYALVNKGMSLSAFKRIFWWEWGHRLLGRIIGAAFLLPFVFFLWRAGSRRPSSGGCG